MTNQVYGAGLTSEYGRFHEPSETEEGPELYEHEEPCPFCQIIGGDGTIEWQSWSETKYNPEEEAGRAVYCWQCGQPFETSFEMVEQEGQVLQWDGPNRGTSQPAPPLAVFKFIANEPSGQITNDQLNAYLERLHDRASKADTQTLDLLIADFKAFPFLAAKMQATASWHGVY